MCSVDVSTWAPSLTGRTAVAAMAAGPWLLLLAARGLAGQQMLGQGLHYSHPSPFLLPGLEDVGTLATLEVSTLGRAVHLGGLYSSHRGDFLPSSNLWNSSITEETKVPRQGKVSIHCYTTP